LRSKTPASTGKSPSILDLFAAPGGLSEGFRDAGYRIIAQVDSDRWGCETLSSNFAPTGTLVIESDIEEIQLRANVDVVIGGPPCQSFSQVGRPKINDLRKNHNRKRFIDDKRNRLYRQFVKIVGSVKPQFFVMENVPGIASFGEGRIKEQIIEDFAEAGYLTEVRILKAADFGVPQVRRRAIFVGNRLGFPNPFPSETHFDHRQGRRSIANSGLGLLSYTTVFDAISDLPPLQTGEGNDEAEYVSEGTFTEYQKWAREGSSKLYNHVARVHSTRDRDLFRLLKQGQTMVDLPKRLRPYRSDIFADKIKKQSWNQLSRAIVAHMQKDGLMFIHPDENQARSFTPREAARIQSFRDSFRFIGPMTQQFRQIGNATPPLLARAVAYAIRPFIEPSDPKLQYPLISTQISN